MILIDENKTNNYNEKVALYHVHYPAFKYAKEFTKYGWDLFNQTKYPFLRSFGNSILFKADNLIPRPIWKTEKPYYLGSLAKEGPFHLGSDYHRYQQSARNFFIFP